MKLLIAVKSCRKSADLGCHEAIRNTWGGQVAPAELKFFVGSMAGDIRFHLAANGGDCESVDAPDDYDDLPLKTRDIARWFLKRDYDYVFLCDNDTFVIPERLMKCGFERYDYAGRFRFGKERILGATFDYKDDGRGNRIEKCHPWALGGFGYFLSRKAATAVAAMEPEHWAEDLCVGQALGPLIESGQVTACDLPEFADRASWHFPKKAYGHNDYDPSFGWMEKMYWKSRFGLRTLLRHLPIFPGPRQSPPARNALWFT